MSLLDQVRRSLPHYISDEVGSWAGLGVRELQQVIAGTYYLTPEQIEQLAKRMHLLEQPR